MASDLEHANVTVSNPDETARWLCDVFGWHVRWKGPSIRGGTTVHVGSENSYLALYTMGHGLLPELGMSYHRVASLNHLAVVVEDISATAERVRKAGFTPGALEDYEPGLRFYFRDSDGIEFEVVDYG